MSPSLPNPQPLSLSDEALTRELTECTNECHSALQANDYAAAYQCLLHRAPLIQEAVARKLSLSAELHHRIADEMAMQRSVDMAMRAVEGKIGQLKQSKHKVSQYKTSPTPTGIVTRGFA